MQHQAKAGVVLHLLSHPVEFLTSSIATEQYLLGMVAAVLMTSPRRQKQETEECQKSHGNCYSQPETTPKSTAASSIVQTRGRLIKSQDTGHVTSVR